jgi:hypothetical protein
VAGEFVRISIHAVFNKTDILKPIGYHAKAAADNARSAARDLLEHGDFIDGEFAYAVQMSGYAAECLHAGFVAKPLRRRNACADGKGSRGPSN